MKRISIAFAALAALVSFSGVAVVAHAAGPVKCEVTNSMGKKEIKEVATEADCKKMGGRVVTEVQPKK